MWAQGLLPGAPTLCHTYTLTAESLVHGVPGPHVQYLTMSNLRFGNNWYWLFQNNIQEPKSPVMSRGVWILQRDGANGKEWAMLLNHGPADPKKHSMEWSCQTLPRLHTWVHALACSHCPRLQCFPLNSQGHFLVGRILGTV